MNKIKPLSKSQKDSAFHLFFDYLVNEHGFIYSNKSFVRILSSHYIIRIRFSSFRGVDDIAFDIISPGSHEFLLKDELCRYSKFSHLRVSHFYDKL